MAISRNPTWPVSRGMLANVVATPAELTAKIVPDAKPLTNKSPPTEPNPAGANNSPNGEMGKCANVHSDTELAEVLVTIFEGSKI